MKKQLILAAMSVALLGAVTFDATAGSSSGFSSSKSSSKSSSSSSSSKSSTSYSSSSSKSTPSVSRRESPVSRPDYGRSAASSYAAPKSAKAQDYTPSYRITPQAAPTPSKPTSVPVANTSPLPPKNGFGTEAISTKKKLVGAAGATALGGALYAAGSNHDAVTAYTESQRPAPTPAPVPSSVQAPTSSPSSASTNARVAASSNEYRGSPSGEIRPSPVAPVVVQSAPQVIVVHDRSPSHADSLYEVDRAYRAGMRAAQAQQQQPPRMAASTADVPTEHRAAQPTAIQPAPISNASQKQAHPESSVSGWWFVFLLVLIGAVIFAAWYLTRPIYQTSAPAPAKRQPNYTL